MPKMDYKRRVALLIDELEKEKLDAFLVTNETNVTYLSAFPGQDSFLLVTPGRKFFLTDSRYVEEARETVKGFEIVRIKESAYRTIAGLIEKRRLKRIGFESMDIPYEPAAKLKKIAGKTGLVPVKDLVESIRAVKDDVEIGLIKESVKLALRVFDRIAKLVTPGATEKDLARAVELEFIGADARPSFEPIIAAGANSSKPHAHPTGAKVAKDSFVMIDIGCRLDGYCSDFTRMVLTGKISARFKKIYDIVKAAHDKAINAIKPGRRIAEIDLAGRGYIEKKGFGKYFGHSLGHGVGMSVHEQPSVSRLNEGVFKAGMVITVEPAIYIPKFGGVRIEDMVLVTNTGCLVLTSGGK